MPKSGQSWNPNFLLGHPLFQVFEEEAKELRGTEFPDMEALTAFSERARKRRAPQARPLRFFPMAKKPRRARRTSLQLENLYDGSIALRGEVPCLVESYHDLFNAIAFSAFARSKRKLHERQFAALKNWVGDSVKLPGKRTREQDALTIFDEGGVVVVMDPNFFATWKASTEPTTIAPFSPTTGVVPLLFGHALLEHLLEGHTQVRASAVVLELQGPIIEAEVLIQADRYLEARLADPNEFRCPGADGIFVMDGESLSIGPPKPSWSAWNPGDRESFQSRYAPQGP